MTVETDEDVRELSKQERYAASLPRKGMMSARVTIPKKVEPELRRWAKSERALFRKENPELQENQDVSE